MTKRSTPSGTEQLDVMRLLADVAAMKADPVAQRQHLVDALNDLFHARAGWLYVADDFVPGRVPVFRHQVLARDPDPEFLRSLAVFAPQIPIETEPFADHVLRDSSPLQLWTRDRVFDRPDARARYAMSSAMYDASKVADGMVGVYRDRVRPDRIVGLAFHRTGRAPKLKPREHALLKFTLAELQRLVDRGHVPLGIPMPSGLPPRLQQVLTRLLAGGGVKRMAREMDLSVWTVREYIQRLYRHFDVSSREELMAQFVNR